MDESENDKFLGYNNANLLDIKIKRRYDTKKQSDKYSIQKRTYPNFFGK